MSEKVKNEKRGSKTVLVDIFIFLTLVLTGIYLYAKYVEPKSLEVKEERIVSEIIPKSFSGVKIVYFSDLLLFSNYNLDDFNNVVNTINELNPDLVIFGGNLISKNHKLKEKEREKLIDLLSKIDTNMGKYTTVGNLDKEEVLEIYSLSSFNVLDNKVELLYKEDNSPICLSGISSYTLSKYNLESLSTCNNFYHILVTHESDITDLIMETYSPNIILTGNTLGGEVNLPMYGPLSHFEGSKNYYKDFYKKGNTLIYINNGMGSRKIKLRLFNKPSINFFRLKSN